MSQPVVVITGAGRGVGRASVERFLEHGWRVVATVRDVAAARQALGQHDALAIIPMDLTDTDRIGPAMQEAADWAGGPFDCIVNNAGHALMGAAEDTDFDQVRAMFQANFFGAAEATSYVLPAMREAGRGVVVCVSSIGSRLSNPLLGYYHATKYAMTAWAEAMRVETLPFGIRVHMIEPGMIDTDFPQATRRTGAMFDGEGPYVPLLTELRQGFGAWRERCDTDADLCADAVYAAAVDPATPFRVPVGDDAAEMAAARARLSDEEFHRWLLDFLPVRWG